MKVCKIQLDKILRLLCVTIFILMVSLTTYQIIVRYIFKNPSSISETLTKYLFVWLIILSATYVFGQREHISINFLKDKLSESMRKKVEILIEFINMFFAASVMIYGGFVITSMNMLQKDSILKIPTGIIYSVIPVCGLMIVFYSFYNISISLKKGE